MNLRIDRQTVWTCITDESTYIYIYRERETERERERERERRQTGRQIDIHIYRYIDKVNRYV